MSAQIVDTPFQHELCIRYFEGNANTQVNAYIEMNFPWYKEWLSEKRKNWLRSERAYQDLEFLHSMSEKNICSFLNQLGCPFDVTTKQKRAPLIQAYGDIHIVPLDHQAYGDIRIIPLDEEEHNNFLFCNKDEAWNYRRYLYWAVDDTDEESAELRAAVENRASYPRFLAWLEFKRECYLLGKVVCPTSDLTWFRELDENSKCHLLRNFQGCHYANNRFYFSHLNSNRQGLPIGLEPLYESDISSDQEEFDPE